MDTSDLTAAGEELARRFTRHWCHSVELGYPADEKVVETAMFMRLPMILHGQELADVTSELLARRFFMVMATIDWGLPDHPYPLDYDGMVLNRRSCLNLITSFRLALDDIRNENGDLPCLTVDHRPDFLKITRRAVGG